MHGLQGLQGCDGGCGEYVDAGIETPMVRDGESALPVEGGPDHIDGIMRCTKEYRSQNSKPSTRTLQRFVM